MNLAEQIIQQKEALIRRAVTNAMGSAPDDLGTLVGRLQCASRTDPETEAVTELWAFDNVHVLTVYPVHVVGKRAVVQGVVHNEPEPEALPERGEVVRYARHRQ